MPASGWNGSAVKGYTVPTWPKEYGGGGLTKAEARILHEEMRTMNCRPAMAF